MFEKPTRKNFLNLSQITKSIKSYFQAEEVLIPGKTSLIRSKQYRLTIKASYTLAPTIFLACLLMIELLFPPNTAFTQNKDISSETKIQNISYDTPISDIPVVDTTANSPELEEQPPTYHPEPTEYHEIYDSEENLHYQQPTKTNIQSNGESLNADYLFNMVNNHRAQIGAQPFEKDNNLCSLAQERAGEIQGELASGTLHSGIARRGLRGQVVENAISISNEDRAFNWWMNSGVHRESIESGKKNSCTACQGKACVQLFSN